MTRCFRVPGNRNVFHLHVLLLAFICLLGFSLPADPASAAVGRARDVITGDPAATLSWSEGVWSQSHNPVPGCVTFPGGLDTGPGHPNAADSVTCSPVPDGWDWSVVVPGPFTLYYSFYGIPPGYTVCGQVFGLADRQHVEAKVSLGEDWMICRDLDDGTVLWEGKFSKFEPGLLGSTFVTATRCGRVRVIPEGACCYPDGHCEYVIQEQCQGTIWAEGIPCDPNPCPQPQGACCYADGHCEYVTEAECPTGDWREGVPCEPDNPCPPPVPASQTDWGQIKARYR